MTRRPVPHLAEAAAALRDAADYASSQFVGLDEVAPRAVRREIESLPVDDPVAQAIALAVIAAPRHLRPLGLLRAASILEAAAHGGDAE